MKKIFISVVCGALCVAAAANVSETAMADRSSTNALDFSRSGYGYSVISAEQFLEGAGFPVSQNEREYLGVYSDFSVKYSNKIADSYISTEEEKGNLYILATPYSYVAANGTTVVWSPYAVDGNPISDGRWDINLEQDDDFVTVSYNTRLAIGKDYVNAVLNQYYNAVEGATEKLQAKQNEYDEAVVQYERDYADYAEYLEELARYEEDCVKYSNYLAEYAEWKRKDDLYKAYLSEYDEYLKELEEYENYDEEAAQRQYQSDMQRYQEYLIALKNYQDKYQNYLESMGKPEIAMVNGQISILSYMYTVAGDNRTIRNAIMGGTVTQVLENPDDLVLAGAERAAVNRADIATRNLRDLISSYDKIKNGDDEDKYIFYITSYESLKENFNDLLRTLDYFFRNDTIYAIIQGKEKVEQYSILLAQLYEICDSLNEESVTNYETEYKWKVEEKRYFDENYTISGSKPSDILGGVTLDYSGDPVPLETGYPEMPQEPVEPEEVDFPEPPVHLLKPVEPDSVEDPGSAPDKVDEPGDKPSEVSKPEYPTAYVPTEWEKKLADDYGNISYRIPFESEYNLKLSVDVLKYFRNGTTLTMRFYLNRADDEYVYEAISVNGSFVEYPADKPLPEMELKGHTCTFDGWEYYDGTAVDWDDLPTVSVVNVYPRFTITPNEYDVIWVIDGVEYIGKATYGELPVYNGEQPKKSNEGLREYKFIGWDSEFIPTTEEPARYVAQFEGSLLITWQIDNQSVITSVWRGETPIFDGVPHRAADSMRVYTFKGWDKEIVPAISDTVYSAIFDSEYILPNGLAGYEVTFEDGTYSADCKGQQTLKVDLILELAAENDAGVIIRCSNFIISFSASDAYSYAHSEVIMLEISIVQTGHASYLYTVNLADGTGNPVDFSGAFGITFSGAFDTVNSRLYRTDGSGKTTDARISLLTEQSITFNMRGDCVYEIYPLYTVNVAQSDEISVYVDVTSTRSGEIVTVTLGDIPAGKFVEKLYVVDAKGNDVAVSNDFTFRMPTSDVVVGAVLGYIEYKIEFRLDGKVLSSKTYHYGDTVVPPTNPVKAPDGVYSYIFTGWDSEIETVTRDMVYNAVFDSELLPVTSGGLSNFAKVLIGAFVGAVVAIAATITAVVIIVRKKKKKG